MPRESDNIDWTPEAIEHIRAGYVARHSRAEIKNGLQEKFGIEPSPRSIESALARYCAEERRAVMQATREELNANRARASELISSGRSVKETAAILQVPEYLVYDWVPSSVRRSDPKNVMALFNAYLGNFQPSAVPEDPIVDSGALVQNLGPEDCRWPIGKDADGKFRFCGCRFHRPAGIKRGRPYCASHTAIDVNRGGGNSFRNNGSYKKLVIASSSDGEMRLAA